MKTLLKKRISSPLFSLSGLISGLAIVFIFAAKQGNQMHPHRLLCLGDSYTIGESVPSDDNFPNQTIKLLRQDGLAFDDPDIVAKTGWTTDELEHSIDPEALQSDYDFVTLLIGVNNQYRGRTVAEYRPQFESLLKQAVDLAGGKNDHVIVLSIPDWGVTPFAGENADDSRKPEQISKEIDEFNAANKEIATSYHVQYINITGSTRLAKTDRSLVAKDGLHPSSKEYSIWARELSGLIKSLVK